VQGHYISLHLFYDGAAALKPYTIAAAEHGSNKAHGILLQAHQLSTPMQKLLPALQHEIAVPWAISIAPHHFNPMEFSKQSVAYALVLYAN
jgi:hypothetical protein